MKHLPIPVVFSMLIAGCCRPTPAAPPLVLARDGHSAYTIVLGAQPTEAERFAADELAAFFARLTGAALPVAAEPEFRGGPGLYVGWTAVAAGQGLDAAALGPEEWVIRAANGNLVLAGGRPRGTLYAVYEFLDRFGGVRFLDEQTEHVPTQSVWRVAADTSRRGRPAYAGLRGIEGYGSPFNARRCLYDARQRLNGRSYGRPLGFTFRYGRPGSTHTFHLYAEGLDDPACWALNAQGRRVREYDLCQSNPRVREHFKARLRAFIRLDREEIDRAGLGEPYPVYYDISANDAGDGRCHCERCKAAAGRYGAYSGLLLEFINEIAGDIARDYPELVIQTFAYKYTAEPPAGIRPRDNVLIRLATLTSDMPADGHEKLRPMEDPVNAVHRARIEGWSAIAKHLGVWTYWEMFQASATWPRSLVGCLGPDLRFYRRCGVDMFYTEARPTSFYNFTALTRYLGAALLRDPGQDDRALAGEFLDLYYGAAAPVMREFLEYLERRQRDDPGRMTRLPLSERRAFDRAFFLEAERLLTEAERRTAGDPARQARVRLERLPVDEALLWLWQRLEQDGPLPWQRDAILARYRETLPAGCAAFGVAGSVQAAMARTLEYLAHMPPRPAVFHGQRIRDITWPLFQQGALASRRVDDPAAAGGRALRLDETMRERRADEHDRPPEFGLHHGPTREVRRVTLARDKIPGDEAYHFYYVGRTTRGKLEGSTLWVHHSWMISLALRVAANAQDPEPDRPLDVYLSMKLEGPAYVPGSTNLSALSVDRIVLVEREAGDPEAVPGDRL